MALGAVPQELILTADDGGLAGLFAGERRGAEKNATEAQDRSQSRTMILVKDRDRL